MEVAVVAICCTSSFTLGARESKWEAEEEATNVLLVKVNMRKRKQFGRIMVW